MYDFTCHRIVRKKSSLKFQLSQTLLQVLSIAMEKHPQASYCQNFWKNVDRLSRFLLDDTLISIYFMYGIYIIILYTYIYLRLKPHVGKFSIHRAFGIRKLRCLFSSTDSGTPPRQALSWCPRLTLRFGATRCPWHGMGEVMGFQEDLG